SATRSALFPYTTLFRSKKTITERLLRKDVEQCLDSISRRRPEGGAGQHPWDGHSRRSWGWLPFRSPFPRVLSSRGSWIQPGCVRSEEHTSELQSPDHLV